jgi:hypothetical protein
VASGISFFFLQDAGGSRILLSVRGLFCFAFLAQTLVQVREHRHFWNWPTLSGIFLYIAAIAGVVPVDQPDDQATVEYAR